jgi:pSer/pThr/pTyr-binding forkhead associated (FHA) protein
MSDDQIRIDPEATVIGGVEINRTLVVPGPRPAGGATGDTDRTQLGAAITCPVCKAVTPSTEAFCGDCGFLLASEVGAPITAPLVEMIAAELVDSVSGRRFRLRPGVNTVGRHTTDVLLDDHTVSRMHARIVLEEGAITVEDLGSSNGTIVGGVRLSPNQPVSASPGAELRFASWVGFVNWIGGGAVAAQPDTTVVMTQPVPDATLIARPATAASAFEPTQLAAAGDIVSQASPPALSSEASAVAQPVPAPEAAMPDGPAIAMLKSTAGPAPDIAVYAGAITVGRRTTNVVVIANDSYVSGRHVELNSDEAATYLTDQGSTNGTLVNGRPVIPHDRILLNEGDEVQIGQTHFRYGRLNWPAPAEPEPVGLPYTSETFGTHDAHVYALQPAPSADEPVAAQPGAPGTGSSAPLQMAGAPLEAAGRPQPGGQAIAPSEAQDPPHD